LLTSPVQDGTSATSGSLASVSGLAADSAGNLFIGAENFIRRVDAKTGIITTLAGSATAPVTQGPALSVGLYPPTNLFIDSAGVLWFVTLSGIQALGACRR